MKILISGAAGFIGSHLGNKLVTLGHQVTGVDNFENPSGNKVNFPINKDSIIDANLKLASYEVVFHLAAYINVDESIENPAKYIENNTVGTRIFLDKVKSECPSARFIFASSAEVYGTAAAPKMDESHPLDPLSPYAVSKLAAEQLCKVYAQIYGLPIIIVRNFNTFGEHQHGGIYGGVIAKFTKLAKAGKDLPVYGSGEQMRDFMYINQAVNGYVLAMEQSNMPLIINFGSGLPIKIIDIANFIAKKFGVGVYHDKSRPNEIMRLEADISRAMHYGYKVETSFWENLEKYLHFNEKN